MATATARSIIQNALESLNRLSTGETMSADLTAFCLRKLTDLVDEWSANSLFLQREIITTTNQTGDITLGVGAWVDIVPGSTIVSVACGRTIPWMPMATYMQLTPSTGTPSAWTFDGVATLFLSPTPDDEVVAVLSRIGVQEFADLDTEYTVAPGYRAALAASLAVRCAPSMLGGVPPGVVMAERRALHGIRAPRPAINDVYAFRRAYRESILGEGGGVLIGYDIVDGGGP